jgi:hypothetical protein
VLDLDVTDHGLDRRAAARLPLDGRCDASLLAGGEDPDLVGLRCIVAAVSCRGEDKAGLACVRNLCRS